MSSLRLPSSSGEKYSRPDSRIRHIIGVNIESWPSGVERKESASNL
ncbi:uncharacterized protein METZ01_LOCUS112774 [marine metagenome]|uniref:Uncharacterized protein n=1 Tax=marine metagenome TaxID=408172 RepID=A0A381X5L3_9ZZZZ